MSEAPIARPDVDTECPRELVGELVDDLQALLLQRFDASLNPDDICNVRVRLGKNAAFLRCRIGPERRPHDFELFIRDVPGEELDGALGVLVDYLDGVLEEWFADDREGYLPLELSPRDYDDDLIVWARSEVRDLDAEDAAELLLKGNGAN